MNMYFCKFRFKCPYCGHINNGVDPTVKAESLTRAIIYLTRPYVFGFAFFLSFLLAPLQLFAWDGDHLAHHVIKLLEFG
jgi:hypothetical protein